MGALLATTATAGFMGVTAPYSHTPAFETAAAWKSAVAVGSENVAAGNLALDETQGCMVVPMDFGCPSTHTQRFENGNGIYTTLHPAFIGKGGLGTLAYVRARAPPRCAAT